MYPSKKEEETNKQTKKEKQMWTIGGALDGTQRSNIHLFITLLGTFLCFIPLLRNEESLIETSDSVNAIQNGVRFKCTATFLLALAILLFLDMLFDFIMSMVSRAKQQRVKEKKKKDNHVDILIDKEMLVFLIGIVILPMTSFFPHGTVNIVMCTQICSRAQMYLLSGALLASLNRFNDSYFPTLITLGILVSFIISNLIFPYYINHVDSNPDLSVKLYWCTAAFGWFFGVTFFLLLAHYIFDTICFHLCGFKRWKIPYYEVCYRCFVSVADIAENNDNKHPEPNAHRYIYFRLTFCTMVILFVLIRAGIQIQYSYPAMIYLSDYLLFLLLVPPVLLVSCLLVFNLHLVKYEAVESLIEMLDAKKSYVRYISHELRTPLNAAHSGMQLLQADLSMSTQPEDVERLDTLNDVALSITTTVDILNDLLSFEKMEAGLMTLHKSDVHVHHFVESTIDIFYATARGKNISIKVEFDADPSIPLSEPVEPTDLISIDKFKISQVMRNFLSNALKFTPEGGTVTVRVCFLRSVEKKDDLSIRRKPAAEKVPPFAWFSSIFAISSSQKSTKTTLPLAMDGEVEMAGVHGDPLSSDSFHNGMLYISVIDSGAGISADNQKKLFKEIVQFNPEKLQGGGGSGFGLYICKGIVDLHEGVISVFSEGEGSGSTFTVQLPMQQATKETRTTPKYNNCKRLSIADLDRSRIKRRALQPSNEVPISTAKVNNYNLSSVAETKVDFEKSQPQLHLQPPHAQQHLPHPKQPLPPILIQQATPPPQATFRVLLVDDSPINRKLLGKLLKSVGHVCDEANDGDVALTKAKSEHEAGRKYDAILMDFVMPTMDGPTATREIRASGITWPIFGVTGNALESDINTFLSAGANRVLVKPMDMSDFHSAMASMSLSAPVSFKPL